MTEGWWLRRHRMQAKTKRAVDPRASKQFARDFELALRARGQQAKERAGTR